MARIEVNGPYDEPITSKVTHPSHYPTDQRNVYLFVGGEEIAIRVYGDDETRQLMKALASASGGLLATLPDEPALDERDESALSAAVQGDHASEGVADDGA